MGEFAGREGKKGSGTSVGLMAGFRASLSARDPATPQRRTWQLVKTCGHISQLAVDSFFAFQRDSQMKRWQPFSETLESTRLGSIKLGIFSESA